MITKFARLEFELFTKPSKLDFLPRRREFRGMRRTDVRRSEHEIKRNAEIGCFTKPSMIEHVDTNTPD